MIPTICSATTRQVIELPLDPPLCTAPALRWSRLEEASRRNGLEEKVRRAEASRDELIERAARTLGLRIHGRAVAARLRAGGDPVQNAAQAQGS